jgi:hypothetical protein
MYGYFINTIANKTNACMLEIGIEAGKSLLLWLDIFPEFYIYGIEINLPTDSVSSDRYRLMRGDQSSEVDLNKCKDVIRDSGLTLWLIIDDGSHIPEHQLLTFNVLFDLLEFGGVYIIEDVEVSYWTGITKLYGYETSYGYEHPKSIVEVFRKVIDCVNMEFCRQEFKRPKEIWDKHYEFIESVTFSRNCIIIRKGIPARDIYRMQFAIA